MSFYKHELSDVKSTKIGINTTIWQFTIILEGAQIGEGCNINCHTFIENDVVIGNNVTIKSGVYVWDGLRIENNVFIGPNVTFVNDKFPRSKKHPKKFPETIVKEGASIGANSTIMSGITIGKFAMIGAGTLVTKNIPDFALVYGHPSQIKGWVNEKGEILTKQEDNIYVDEKKNYYRIENDKLIKL
jgi:UDP-2-acetamido-3-amino-2,3-dideoxy-glucuronate N-acetyltransferase